MDFAVSEQVRIIQSNIAAFCREKLSMHDLVQRDRDEIFSRKLWDACGDFGMLGLQVGKEEGGWGLKPLDTMYAIEAFGRSCKDDGLSFALNAQLLSVVQPLYQYGQEHLKKKHLTKLASGQHIAAHAITEPQSGSDVFNMATTATLIDGEYLLNGTKSYVSNGPVADVLLVYALTNSEKGVLGGITPFLIECERAGIQMGDKIGKMGLRTCTMGTVSLSNVRANIYDILGEEGGGLKIFQNSINWERIGMAAMLIGIMDRTMEETAATVRLNKRAQQQTFIHLMSNTKAQLEAARMLTYKAAWSLEHAKADVTLLASSAKLITSELLKQFSMAAVQIAGATGYLTDSGTERTLRNAMASTLYSGSSEIQKNIIAKFITL